MGLLDRDVHHNVEENHGAVKDFIPAYVLRHFSGPVGVSPKLISRVRPLFIGLDSPKDEIHRYNDSVQLLMV